MRGYESTSRSRAAPTARRSARRSAAERSALVTHASPELARARVEQDRILVDLLRKEPLGEARHEDDVEGEAARRFDRRHEDAPVAAARRPHHELGEPALEHQPHLGELDRADVAPSARARRAPRARARAGAARGSRAPTAARATRPTSPRREASASSSYEQRQREARAGDRAPPASRSMRAASDRRDRELLADRAAALARQAVEPLRPSDRARRSPRRRRAAAPSAAARAASAHGGSDRRGRSPPRRIAASESSTARRRGRAHHRVGHAAPRRAAPSARSPALARRRRAVGRWHPAPRRARGTRRSGAPRAPSAAHASSARNARPAGSGRTVPRAKCAGIARAAQRLLEVRAVLRAASGAGSAMRSKGTPRSASRWSSRAISTHSRLSPGADRMTTSFSMLPGSAVGEKSPFCKRVSAVSALLVSSTIGSPSNTARRVVRSSPVGTVIEQVTRSRREGGAELALAVVSQRNIEQQERTSHENPGVLLRSPPMSQDAEPPLGRPVWQPRAHSRKLPRGAPRRGREHRRATNPPCEARRAYDQGRAAARGNRQSTRSDRARRHLGGGRCARRSLEAAAGPTGVSSRSPRDARGESASETRQGEPMPSEDPPARTAGGACNLSGGVARCPHDDHFGSAAGRKEEMLRTFSIRAAAAGERKIDFLPSPGAAALAMGSCLTFLHAGHRTRLTRGQHLVLEPSRRAPRRLSMFLGLFIGTVCLIGLVRVVTRRRWYGGFSLLRRTRLLRRAWRRLRVRRPLGPGSRVPFGLLSRLDRRRAKRRPFWAPWTSSRARPGSYADGQGDARRHRSHHLRAGIRRV